MSLQSLKDKTILITGGTGSFGKAFIKHILRSDVHKVIVFSRDELKQYEMRKAITDDSDRIRYFIGDVRDRDRLYTALHNVDVVFHAAALKHIDVGEYNPREFIKTNVYGTENLMEAASAREVKKVVVLSTDKASAPVSTYGATKLLMEQLLRSGQSYDPAGTKFMCLRYGNVAGSRGSVIPAWKKLVQEGADTLPITHSSMSRFFFTLEQAVNAALWVAEFGKGGDLIVPKMPSFKLIDLVYAFGCSPKVTGIRGVEKLAESLISRDEAPYFRDYGNLFIRSRAGRDFENSLELPEGFQYTSDTALHQLTVDDLRKEIAYV